MPKPRTQLLTYRQSRKAKCQHRTPCSDCPWARKALPGWLGAFKAQQWLHIAHSDDKVDCHTLRGAQCAGIAIYRRNVVKTPRDPEVLRLEADRATVFATPQEFLDHHEQGPVRIKWQA
jgi:hypothetical protein